MAKFEPLGLEEALATWLAPVLPVSEEALWPPLAAGRVLARPLRAWQALPAFRRSAVDGYALRAGDLAEGGTLAIATQPVWAGQLAAPLAPGEAVAIATGGALPARADAVLPLEMARLVPGDAGTNRLEAVRPVTAGANLRDVGEDLEAGGLALDAGVRLGADRLPLLLAAAGGRSVLVARRPRVRILPSGDELAPPGRAPEGVHTMEVIGTALALRAQEDGALAVLAPPLPDSLPVLRDALRGAVADADLVVTVGGASVGERDHAAAALVAAGGQVRFHGLRLRPGTPTFGGYLDGRAVLGLPGNPVAALTAWELVGRAVLARLIGTAPPAPLMATLTAPSVKRPVRDDRYLRAHLWLDKGRLWAAVAPSQNAGMLVPMAQTNGVVLHPGAIARLEAGVPVEARLTGTLESAAPPGAARPQRA